MIVYDPKNPDLNTSMTKKLVKIIGKVMKENIREKVSRISNKFNKK